MQTVFSYIAHYLGREILNIFLWGIAILPWLLVALILALILRMIFKR